MKAPFVKSKTSSKMFGCIHKQAKEFYQTNSSIEFLFTLIFWFLLITFIDMFIVVLFKNETFTDTLR